MRRRSTILLLFGALFVLVSCTGSREPKPVTSVPIDLQYKDGMRAGAIRISNGFFTDNRTIGWMEVHYFTIPEQRPHPDLRAAYWLVEQDIETLATRETLYFASPFDLRGPLTTVRYSDNRLLQTMNRHSSYVWEPGRFYRTSPGGNLREPNDTMKHFPIDYAHGLYLFGEWARDIPGTTHSRLVLADMNDDGRIVWRSEPFPHEVFNLYQAYLPFSSPVGRLVDPKTILLLWVKEPDGVPGSGIRLRNFEFTLVDVESGEMRPLGVLRLHAASLHAWDIDLQSDPPRVAVGHGAGRLPDGRRVRTGTIVSEIGTEVHVGADGGGIAWFDSLWEPAFSPDGRHIIGRTHFTWQFEGRPQRKSGQGFCVSGGVGLVPPFNFNTNQ